MVMSKRTIWISVIIAVVFILSASAETYRRITGIPHVLDDAVDLLLEMAYQHRTEIQEDIAYAEALALTGRTKIHIREGLYVLIADWLVEANAKLDALNAKITPLEAIFE